MGISQALAARVAAAKANQTGNWIKVGSYVFEVRKLLAEKKFRGDTFIAEMLVKSSQKTSVQEPNPAGSTVSYVVRLDDEYGLGVGNMKAFVMALFGCSEAEITPEVLLEVCGEKQPAAGMLIQDEAFERPKKNGTAMFTHHKWAHVPEQPTGNQAK